MSAGAEAACPQRMPYKENAVSPEADEAAFIFSSFFGV
jgi:hypothetical protein